MDVQIYPLGSLQANCYFLVHEKKCLIIDPADEAYFILEKISRDGLNLVGMIATHGHFDHIMAAGEIQLSFDVPLYIHDKDLFLVRRLNETAKHFLGYDPAVLPPRKIKSLSSGDFQIADISFKTIETPGHTPGSCSLYFPDGLYSPAVFTGDTLFRQAIGRYDFSYGDKAKLDQPLAKLCQLDEGTLVYSGHGDITTIGEEKKNLNRF